MIPFLALLLLAPTQPAAVIDAAIAAHARQSSGSAKVIRVQSSGKTRTTDSFDVAWIRPFKALVRFGDGRAVYLNGTNLVAYEPGPNEWLSRVSSQGSSAGDRISASFGQIEYAAHLLLDKDEMKTFLVPLKNGKWKVVESAKTIRLNSVTAKGKPSVSFAFDRKSRLLVEGAFFNSKGSEKWQIAYAKPKTTINYQPPKSATFVRFFASPIDMPKFASKAAEETVKKMVKAYRSYLSGVIVATNDDGTVRMVYDGNRLKQSREAAKWSYDGKTLSYIHAGKTDKYKVSRNDLIDKLAALGEPMDSFLRSLTIRQVPFQNLLAKEAKAAVGGQVTVGGQPCTIVNLLRPGSRASLFVRRDGLVQSLSVESLDASGNVLTSSSRRFVYAPLSPTEGF
jgi:hypothetical protein